MRIHRLYVPQAFIQGERLTVTGQTAHHLAHVLRLQSGDSVQVFNGKGSEHRAVVSTIMRSEVIMETGEEVAVRREPSLQITLLQGIARNDRMDTILQKAVELGVQTIQPLWMQRSQVHLKGSRLKKRFEHWQGVMIGACEQCGRATLPLLNAAINYSDWMNDPKIGGLCILLQPDSETGLSTLKQSGKEVHVLIGPEGGLNTREQEIARAAGFTGVRLGPRILRTETAALAALVGIQTLWGDLM